MTLLATPSHEKRRENYAACCSCLRDAMRAEIMEFGSELAVWDAAQVHANELARESSLRNKASNPEKIVSFQSYDLYRLIFVVLCRSEHVVAVDALKTAATYHSCAGRLWGHLHPSQRNSP